MPISAEQIGRMIGNGKDQDISFDPKNGFVHVFSQQIHLPIRRIHPKERKEMK
jgi:hypothetical protein